MDRLRAEIDELTLRIRRQVANLETESRERSPASGGAPQLKAKRQQQIEAAERAASHHPDPEQAAELLDVLPLVDVDFELLEEAEFRGLLQGLNLEARYDPRNKQLAVKVVLAPGLMGPNDAGPRSSLS